MMSSASNHGGLDFDAMYTAMREARRARLTRTAATVAKSRSASSASERPDPTQPVFAVVPLSTGIGGFTPADVRVLTKALFATADGFFIVGGQDSNQLGGSPPCGGEEEGELASATPTLTPGREAAPKRKKLGQPMSKMPKRRKADELPKDQVKGRTNDKGNDNGQSDPESSSPAQQPVLTLPHHDGDTVLQQSQPQWKHREKQAWSGNSSPVQVESASWVVQLPLPDRFPGRPAPWYATGSDDISNRSGSDMGLPSTYSRVISAAPTQVQSPEAGRSIDSVGTGQAEYDSSLLGGQGGGGHGRRLD